MLRREFAVHVHNVGAVIASAKPGRPSKAADKLWDSELAFNVFAELSEGFVVLSPSDIGLH